MQSREAGWLRLTARMLCAPTPPVGARSALRTSCHKNSASGTTGHRWNTASSTGMYLAVNVLAAACRRPSRRTRRWSLETKGRTFVDELDRSMSSSHNSCEDLKERFGATPTIGWPRSQLTAEIVAENMAGMVGIRSSTENREQLQEHSTSQHLVI